MDIRKIIALSILLLANVMMLAKPVVHYLSCLDSHTTSLCVAKQTCCCKKYTGQHAPSDKKDTPKGCDTEKCFLRNLFVQYNSTKLPMPAFNNSDFFISNISIYPTTQLTDSSSIPFGLKPYIPLFYADFISQSSGLRAPPAC